MPYSGDNMTELIPLLMDMLKRPETHKVLSTVSPEGKPHSVICGSLIVTDPCTIMVGQVYMHQTSVNITANRDVEFLVWLGAQAYSIQATLKSILTEGPEMEKMEQLLGKMNMKPLSVFVFTVNSAYDEGITPKAGTRVL